MDADDGLDVEGLLAAFQEFFREHSEHWVQRFEQYHEAGPQLLLQAHLQRVVNGGGRIEREYALGRGRTDLLIVGLALLVSAAPVAATRWEALRPTQGSLLKSSIPSRLISVVQFIEPLGEPARRSRRPS